MALGDGITWDEGNPVDGTLANLIDDYDRDLRKGVRSRMAAEHEWPVSQSATSEAGVHKFISLQSQGSVPVIAGTQLGSIYMTSGNALVFSVGTTAGTSIIPAVVEAGSVVQVVNYQTGAVATGTTAMVNTDSIPKKTEGTEFMTLAITPKSATNKLKIEVVVNVATATANYTLMAALFQDTTTDALASATMTPYYENRINQIVFTYYMEAGTTSATTFKVRAGSTSTNQFTFNGIGGSRYFGGVMASSITIMEIQG